MGTQTVRIAPTVRLEKIPIKLKGPIKHETVQQLLEKGFLPVLSVDPGK